MSKFKVGDEVRILDEEWGGLHKGMITKILWVSSTGNVRLEDPMESSGGSGWYFDSTSVELVTNNETEKKMGRRTFKLLKDTHIFKKGALVQEECEDGTQPYTVITPEFFKGESEGEMTIAERSLVEDQPDWFVEVFKVTSEYMTQVELERWEEFKRTKRVAKKIHKLTKTVRLTKNGKRLGRPPKGGK